MGCLPPNVRNGEASRNGGTGQEPAVENQTPPAAQECTDEEGHGEEPHAVLVGETEAEH
jgi:hypothetical protein